MDETGNLISLNETTLLCINLLVNFDCIQYSYIHSDFHILKYNDQISKVKFVRNWL